MNAAQSEAIDRLLSELDQLEWEMEDESSLLFAGNSADGPVLGTIDGTGHVFYYTS